MAKTTFNSELFKFAVFPSYENAITHLVGNVFIFCVIEDPNYGFMSMITPKSYYDREGDTYDIHLDYILNLPKHFEELTEATFASEKSDVECIH